MQLRAKPHKSVVWANPTVGEIQQECAKERKMEREKEEWGGGRMGREKGTRRSIMGPHL